MLSQTNTRLSAQRNIAFTETFPVSVDTALRGLIRGEFSFGCRVVLLEPQRIKVETQVLSWLDEVTIEGEVQEMREIYTAVAAYAQAYSRVDRQALVERLEQFSRGNPLLAVHGLGLVLGSVILAS